MLKERQFSRFVQTVSKLEPVEYCALCKILGVSLFDGTRQKEFHETLEEVLDKYLNMGKKPRKQLNTLLRAATKEREHGTETED